MKNIIVLISILISLGANANFIPSTYAELTSDNPIHRDMVETYSTIINGRGVFNNRTESIANYFSFETLVEVRTAYRLYMRYYTIFSRDNVNM